MNNSPQSDFVPDFDCRVIASSRILRITRNNYLKCMQGKFQNFNPSNPSTKQLFERQAYSLKRSFSRRDKNPGLDRRHSHNLPNESSKHGRTSPAKAPVPPRDYYPIKSPQDEPFGLDPVHPPVDWDTPPT